ncbi:hypothetical protein ILUMI_08103 [Ignelater luminosus]|uniref:Uncharacterized protein n=1 Tax=Ignelater luminosus TaxID=2038154 RepID=A0A8K0DBZ4_IGNLU|nr:hypothetical protein ILUMI_08103 [Ignelater luminosus]
MQLEIPPKVLKTTDKKKRIIAQKLQNDKGRKNGWIKKPSLSIKQLRKQTGYHHKTKICRDKGGALSTKIDDQDENQNQRNYSFIRNAEEGMIIPIPSTDEVEAVMYKLKNKAPGEDGITSKLIKNGGMIIISSGNKCVSALCGVLSSKNLSRASKLAVYKTVIRPTVLFMQVKQEIERYGKR